METKDVLFKLRTDKGLSQDELAEKIFVTRQAVSRWENGETVPNMVVTAVAFTENGPAENRKALARLPLTQADYCEMKGESDHAEYSYQKSFFGSRLQGTVIWPNEELEENELSYNVYRSEYAWVLHKIWETETDTMYYKGTKETDPRPWKALEVRRNKNGIATCARYEDALLFLYADTPPAADQIELTLETLNLLKDTN